jgi:hypothetical protein
VSESVCTPARRKKEKKNVRQTDDKYIYNDKREKKEKRRGRS